MTGGMDLRDNKKTVLILTMPCIVNASSDNWHHIDKVAFYKMSSGRHALYISILVKTTRVPPRSDVNHCTMFKNNNRKQSRQKIHPSLQVRVSWNQDKLSEVRNFFFRRRPLGRKINEKIAKSLS